VNTLNSVSPVFVVAPVRSGSTVLHLMLDSHPEIINSGECDFFFDQLNGRKFPKVKEYHKWLTLNRIFNAKKLEVDVGLSYLDLIYSFIAQLKKNDSILALNVHRNFQRIPYVFPEAKYIHLLRDPRDVARSCIGMGWVGHVYYGVDIWIDAESAWDQLQVTLKDAQYIEVRYEDLIQNTEQTLTDICEFLGVEYSAEMMDYAAHSTYDLPDKRLVYQWKKNYSERELCLVEGKLGGMLADRGYDPSGFPSATPRNYELVWLALTNKSYRIKFNIKTYGLFLYIANIVSKRVRWPVLREYCQRRINSIDIQGLK
jgi:hypothetical protein